MAKKAKKPADMLHLLQSTQGTLAQIAKKTNYLKQLDDIVQKTCPDLPQDVWHIANFRQNSIVIEVKSSIWSQRLQFERMNIAQAIAEFTENAFNKIEIKVAPYFNKAPEPSFQHTETTPNTRKISQETADNLRQVAEKAPPSLQAKLEKLARLSNK